MRIATTMIVTAGLLVSLAACSTPVDDSAADCATTPSGSVSDSVKVTGDFLKEPKVDFKIPLAAPEATQRSVVIKGDGDVVKDGDTVNVLFSLYSGASSADIAGTDWAKGTTAELPVDATQFLPGIVKTLECSTVGSRIVGVIPPADAFGEAGSPDLGVAATDALVFVVDIESIKAPLKPAAWTKDVPEVTFAEDGSPTVTLPETAPPTELVAKVLDEGDGAEITAGQTVTLDYQGTSWEDGVMFDQSYGKEPLTKPTTIYVPGFAAALVGQKIGSTILIGIPAEYGYGTEPTENGLGGKTLVFVVHIIS